MKSYLDRNTPLDLEALGDPDRRHPRTCAICGNVEDADTFDAWDQLDRDTEKAESEDNWSRRQVLSEARRGRNWSVWADKYLMCWRCSKRGDIEKMVMLLERSGIDIREALEGLIS